MNRRITAANVMASPTITYDTRICYRCGLERRVSGKSVRSRPYLCQDCKGIDPALAKRLGY